MSKNVTTTDVVKSTGTALLGRAGAVIEVVSQPLYVRFFGLANYGLYTVLWALVSIGTVLCELGQSVALQRLLPVSKTEQERHSLLKTALLLALGASVLLATLLTLALQPLQAMLNVAPQDEAALRAAILLMVWTLPAWTLLEITTSAMRAMRAFGPEIRLKTLYEQLFRLSAALGFWALGYQSLGLILAQWLSALLTLALSFKLLFEFFSWHAFWQAPLHRAHVRMLLGYGVLLIPSGLIRRAFLDIPVLLLNALLPGAQGAIAAGLYGIARKVASIIQMVRLSVGYVMSPLVSYQTLHDRAQIAVLYSFATRLGAALVLPITSLLIGLGPLILSLFGPELKSEASAATNLAASNAYTTLLILLAGRAFEATLGPASSLVDVLGKPTQPLINALSGLVLWLILTPVLTPPLGAAGMALAVSLGTAACAVVAILQLKRDQQLWPFQAPFYKILFIGLISTILLQAWHHLTKETTIFLHLTGSLLLFSASLWLSLRLGLLPKERASLGRLGRFLGL
jgi:O-antigen/teichoic acid export membrane protein